MMQRFSPHSWNLLTKIVLLNLAVLLVSFLALILYILPLYEAKLQQHRKRYISELVTMATLVVQSYHHKELQGELTRFDAQNSSVQALKTMAKDNGYFWVHDVDLNMIMHPYVSILEHRDLSNYTDPNGKRLFVEMNRLVLSSGSGYVEYLWPKPAYDKPVPKVSYVALFKPWGWIIGSGMYLDDINTEVLTLRSKVYIATIVVLLLIIFFSIMAAFAIKKPLQQTLQLLQEVPEKFLPVRQQNSLDETGRLLEAMVGLVGNLKSARDEAEAANSAKSQFLAQMSHEIRNPMNAINGLTDLALEQAESIPQRELLEGIRHAATHLLSLINQVLDYSKIEAGAVELELTPFGLRDTIISILLPFSIKARSKGVTFTYVMSEDLPDFVVGDPVRLRQVIANIVSNAVKFTENGSIEVAVSQHAQQGADITLCFRVADTGIGIPEEKKEHIFLPYQQADSTTTRNFGGTGLGLSIVTELVALMGGWISVNSTPGVGTEFTVYLHVHRMDSAPAELQPQRDLPNVAPCPLSVLVAEDNQINSMLLSKLLEKLGHRVTVVSDGMQAVECWKRQSFDLILMDILMPVFDGLEATRAIRLQEKADATSPHTLIIALSGQDTEQDLEAGRQAGVDMYLKKPVTRETLVSALDQLAKHCRDTQTGLDLPD